MIDGFLGQISFRTKVILNVMVWHVERVVESLTMRWLIRMSVTTVIELVVQRRVHVLWANDPRMVAVLRLLNHSVGRRELIILHF